MKQRAVIFDFDGTIADSFEYVFNFLWGEARRKYYRPSRSEVGKYRNMSMKAMALKAGIPWWKLIQTYFKGRRIMRKNMPNIEPFKGMLEQIKLLHDNGYELHIVSSNSRRNIRRFLTEKELDGYFKSVQAGATILGKRRLFAKVLKHSKATPNHCWAVGDQHRDARDARPLGINTIAVTWGFDNAKTLRNYADVVVKHPRDIAKVIMTSADTIEA